MMFLMNTNETIAASTDQMSFQKAHNIVNQVNQSFLGSIAELFEKISILLPVLLFVVVLLFLLVTFRIRVNQHSEKIINALSKNGKYIRGLFVELNDTRELMRYFVGGKKWNRRIIKDYNHLFNDEHGQLLRKMYGKPFHINLTRSVEEIYTIITDTIELMQKVYYRKIEPVEEYKPTAALFSIYGRRYIEKLEKLKIKTEFLKSNYVVLTGSAGNGKTNLLCNLAEVLIRTKRICIFLNSKEITKDVNDYFEEKLSLFNIKFFRAYWFLQNLICAVLNKKIYILIDAVNENTSKEFSDSLPVFINRMLKFSNVRIIASCRSEYFDLKYKSYLIDQVDTPAYCYDIMKEDYTFVAKERLYENYKKAFNFCGELSLDAKEKLFQQLLLMRMFFEVNKDSNAIINTLNKYEIFQKYIDSVMGSNKDECKAFLNTLVEQMYSSHEYSAVRLSQIEAKGKISEIIENFVDDTILLSRKLIIFPNSIREKTDEDIYFVFDEMRDYCVAKYILNTLCDENDIPIEKDIIAYIEKLIELDSVCTEGVINYIYWYYKGENNDAMCQKILYEFMKPHDQALNNFNRRQLERGLNSWGLKVIFEGTDDLKEYEKEYLEFIVYENPGEELLRLFAFFVHQEEIKGRYNLKLYFDILFQIHCREKFCNILINSISSWGNTGINLSELIAYDIKLSKTNPEGAKRFRWYLFLILKCLRWQAKEELEKYWEENCDDTEILQQLDGEIWFEKQEES